MNISIEYLAGLIDGEGCLMITALKHFKDYKRNIRYDPVMQISNTYLPLLQLIQLQYGGRIQRSRADCFVLHFSANKMRELIPQLLPYLIIKKTQAEILMKFLDMRKPCGNISDEKFNAYVDCYRDIKALKSERFALTN